MPDGVVVLNPQTEILWFNRTAARLLGFRGKGDIGLRIENLLRQPEFVRYLRGGQYAMPVMVRSTAGPEQHLSLQIVPYGAGQLLTLVRDVTREARLEAMRTRLRRQRLARAALAVDGDLRLPGDAGAGAGLGAALTGPLQEMRRQAQRMNRIVQDLLELSRLESSDARGERPADRCGHADGAAAPDVLARPLHPAQVQVQADSHALLLGDEVQIHSAFANLVDNAAKYTAGDGSVQMRWWTDAHGGHFSVTDTGIGIAREHIPRLTERFYRVDPGPQPRHRRLGPGAGHRQARAAAARCAAVDRERGGQRQLLQLPLSTRAAAAAEAMPRRGLCAGGPLDEALADEESESVSREPAASRIFKACDVRSQSALNLMLAL